MTKRSHRTGRDRDLIGFFQQLWQLDENRLTPGVDYCLDLQGRANFSFKDYAKNPLFTRVDPTVFEKPTYKAFIALLDNYESSTGVAETVTAQEERENWNFINLIFETEVMKFTHEFLVRQGKVSQHVGEFKKQFYDIWFKLYRKQSNSRGPDSSGFEHVFVGETRGKEVIGFHNWIQFYLQEKAGNVDYKGFMASHKQDSHRITIQFSWKEDVKPKGSSLIGVSPEFETALYTVAYLMGRKEYHAILGKDYVIIKCYRRKDGMIGTCYIKGEHFKRRRR